LDRLTQGAEVDVGLGQRRGDQAVGLLEQGDEEIAGIEGASAGCDRRLLERARQGLRRRAA